ncbi:hypothetical protein TeGR_g6741 [Tetraparma gracilis]|uniref:Uncharacterized protein n=1 Tax=Tetraparma gracilis TaxID=2962635 RepID=A0ABQ6M7J7_9STRA|nr:hypothetical protein TeGR_g6741 [Tetraparma gracilis]
MKSADLLMSTAKLIIAAGFKMTEQARQEMAEEDLGGGMFDQDVRDMRDFTAKAALPQVYDADELEVLDEQLALHDAPKPSLRKYKTGTKLYTCQLADTGSGMDVCAEMEVRAPVEQNREHLNEKILDMIRTTNVLRSAQAKYRFFDEFLFHIIRNAMKRGAVQTAFAVKTPLVALTANEAGRIARSLVPILMANATAVAAIDEHIRTYPALGELDLEYAWFRGMMEAIAAELMNKVAYGVKVRAGIGAAVSFADLLSDAYMTRIYYKTGRSGVGNSLVGMVGANLALQLAMVTLQTSNLKTRRWRTFFWEALSVITFTKPGLDAYKVASGAETIPGASTPLFEMLITKGSELVFEGVPGLILQLIALLNADEKSKSAIISVFISTASTALTATTLFWDVDVDPGARKRNPDWIGIIPNSNRTLAFATVFMMCAFHIIAKAAATALFAVTNSSLLLGYFVADHTLHLLYRVLRRDLIYFLPMPATASYVAAPVLRVIMKIVIDFTGSPLFRLPLNGGGAYWLFSLAASQVSVFAAVHLYNESDDVGSRKIDATSLWTGAGALAGAWLATFLFFVLRIAVTKYRFTLWSWASGRQVAQDYFLKSDEDEDKFEIFGCNLLLWESDIGGEVRTWTTENWERWKEEKPQWFTVELVPDHFLPAAELEQLGHNRKRRGSAVGSVRESFREAGGEDSVYE